MANKKINFTSPFGVAKYPHISSPDTKGKYADNKFKTKLVFDLKDPATQAFVKACDDAATDIHGSAGAKLYKPYKVDEEAGTVEFTFKSQYAPAIFDAKNQSAQKAKVGGGSVIRILGSFIEYDKGITAALNQVQIKSLSSFGSSGFDAVDDGYEYDEADAAPATSDDGEGDSSGGSKLDI
ncbi:hypothetical protein UFOVP344_13 [uncultured Caudovirales phage]|uniref:Uncharacterized protein n=1 Tax=uncultured Caudovirales phage TaxID=2100421 RepID=A0A6J5LXB8_9CAUD|nr:hypothetical protein UFOVP344_13 [uncultured Caudovirales phage]